ncbi:hypothetical protein ACFFOE_000143 [Klebsiella aerogenes]
MSDLCLYISTWGHAGVSTAAGISATATVSNFLPTSDVSQTVGGIGTGGFSGDLTVATQTDVDNPEAISASVGVGVGGGAFGGLMTCGTAQICMVN